MFDTAVIVECDYNDTANVEVILRDVVLFKIFCMYGIWFKLYHWMINNAQNQIKLYFLPEV